MTATRFLSLVLVLAAAACGGKPTPAADAGPVPVPGDAAPPAAPDAVPDDTRASAEPAAAPEKVTSVEGITEYRLANGLRVLLFPDPSVDTVTVNVTYMVGSRHEGYGETGMAHLLEHMLFKGTPTHDDVWKALQQRGAQFNGTTDYDRTNYYETLPASPENLDFALTLEADRMVNSKIAAEDLQTEFSVVRNEFEMNENQPTSILIERMFSTAFLWHNYGQSPIGARSDIERVPVETLRPFYERFYQPDNAVLVVAGKFDPEAALARVNATFGAIPKPTRALSASYTVEPVQDGERAVTLRRVGDVQLVGAVYHVVAGSDPSYPAVQALVHLLTDEPSGRLYQSLVATGKASRVFGMAQPLAEPGTLLVLAEVPVGKPLDVVRDELLATVEGLGAPERAPTAEEIARWQAAYAKQFELLMNDAQSASVALSDWQSLGDWRLMFLFRDRVASTDAASVAAFAAKWLVPANRTLGEFVPTPEPVRSPLAERPDIAPMVASYTGRAAVAEGEAFAPTFDNIEARTERTTLGGVKLAILPKTTRGGAVRARLAVHFGSEADLKGRIAAQALMRELLTRGTAKRSYQQIKDELDRLKSTVTFEGSPLMEKAGTVEAEIVTTRDNLLPVLALVAEMLKEPSFPEDQLAIARKEIVTMLEGSRNDPQMVAIRGALRQLVPVAADDVRYIPTADEAIAALGAVTRDAIVKLHADVMGGDAIELAIVGELPKDAAGAFDTAALKQAVTQHFGAWKAKRPYQRVGLEYRPNGTEALVIDTPDKEAAFIMVAQALPLRDDDPDRAALQLANYVFGGAPASRLMERLRQKEGISYGAFAGLDLGKIDTWSFFYAGALAAPQNSAKALALILEELDRWVAEGVSDKELADAKAAMQSELAGMLADDGWVVKQLVDQLEVGRTLAFEKANADAVQALTAADVKAALAKGRIAKAGLASVIAADAKKAKAP